MKKTVLISGVMLSIASTSTLATTVSFASDPFAGSTALTTPGRQVVTTNEVFLSAFDVYEDVFSIDAAFFDVAPAVSFANALSSDFATSGLNVIVLRDTDNDANPATPFNAGTAANLIASRVTSPGAGFFIYHNSGLGMNRLVYSTNLDDNTADLVILARITTPTGSDAIAKLPRFSDDNFQIVPTPGAATVLGLAGLMGARRRRHR